MILAKPGIENLEAWASRIVRQLEDKIREFEEKLQELSIIVIPLTTITPTPTASSGTITTASSSIKEMIVDNMCLVTGTVSVPDNGTGAGQLRVALTNTAVAASAGQYREGVATGVGGHCFINASSNVLNFVTDANGYPVASGQTLIFSIIYAI